MTCNAISAEDLVQDTLISAITEFRSEDSVRARLTRIRRALRGELERVWREWA